jgi:hypothetical protein
MSLAADHSHQLPALTYVVFRVDGLRHKLFDGLPFPRSLAEEEYDDDTYLETRLHIVQGSSAHLRGGSADSPRQGSFVTSNDIMTIK